MKAVHLNAMNAEIYSKKNVVLDNTLIPSIEVKNFPALNVLSKHQANLVFSDTQSLYTVAKNFYALTVNTKQHGKIEYKHM